MKKIELLTGVQPVQAKATAAKPEPRASAGGNEAMDREIASITS